MNKKKIITIDIGGTNTKSCLLSFNKGFSVLPNIQYFNKQPTLKSNAPPIIMDCIVALVKRLISYSNPEPIDAIGICCTGIIDKSGKLIKSVNLPFINYPLKKQISKIFNLPVLVENDARAAAIGEIQWGVGAGKKLDTVIHIVMGTGIGGAILKKGHILKGKANIAGEFGHMVIDLKGPICRCGKQGCVDAYSSAAGIINCFKNKMKLTLRDKTISSKKTDSISQIIKAAKKGNKIACESLYIAGSMIGLLISNLNNAFNPDAFIISGGLLNADDLIWEPLMKNVKKLSFISSYDNIQILKATLGELSGLLGIAFILKNEIYNKLF